MIDLVRMRNELDLYSSAIIPTRGDLMEMVSWIERAAALLPGGMPHCRAEAFQWISQRDALLAELAPAPTMGGDLWPGEETGDK